MKQQGIDQTKWLKEIDEDQNLSSLGQLVSTIQNMLGRRWFRSKVLQPTLNQGYYEPSTGRYVLGQPLPRTATTVSNALNTPLVTLTCPANHVYKILHANGSNNTTAALWEMIYTPSGGSATVLHRTIGSSTSVAGALAPHMNGAAVNQALGAQQAQMIPFYMRPGDTLTVENTNDVAGDTILIQFIYEDYTLEG